MTRCCVTVICDATHALHRFVWNNDKKKASKGLSVADNVDTPLRVHRGKHQNSPGMGASHNFTNKISVVVFSWWLNPLTPNGVSNVWTCQW